MWKKKRSWSNGSLEFGSVMIGRASPLFVCYISLLYHSGILNGRSQSSSTSLLPVLVGFYLWRFKIGANLDAFFLTRNRNLISRLNKIAMFWCALSNSLSHFFSYISRSLKSICKSTTVSQESMLSIDFAASSIRTIDGFARHSYICQSQSMFVHNASKSRQHRASNKIFAVV